MEGGCEAEVAVPEGAVVPAERAAKRAKVQYRAVEYSLTINSPHSFKSACEIVSNVLINTHFHVVSTPTFSGLRIDSVDPGCVCMVKARFACTVEMERSDQSHHFCVRMKTLNTLLKHISAQHVLQIVKYADSPHILLRAFDKKDETSSIEFTLKTINEKCEDLGLFNLDSKYTVEIDLSMFKSICKMCKDIKAPVVQFKISVCPGEQDLYFNLSSEGDEAILNYTFHSTNDTDSGDVIIHAKSRPLQHQPKEEDLQVVYQECFSADFLNLFMKSMEKQTIYMTVAPDRPLILHYNLGAYKSYIRFVLAPKVD
jgi:hypothetical protein